MDAIRAILVTSAIMALATPAMAAASAAVTKPGAGQVRSGEISSAQRKYHHRRYIAPQPAPVLSYHRGFADPSIAPNGRPYVVPEYLRGQCYMDEGYGRFRSCSNRN